MNTQPPASSEIRASLPGCGERDERPPTVTITRSDDPRPRRSARAAVLKCTHR